MNYPKKVLIYTLQDGTKIYQDIASEEEYEEFCREIEECREYVRNYFAQYYL